MDGTASDQDASKTWPQGEHDADFVAEARADVPALLAEVERLRAALTHYAKGYPGGIGETAREALQPRLPRHQSGGGSLGGREP